MARRVYRIWGRYRFNSLKVWNIVVLFSLLSSPSLLLYLSIFSRAFIVFSFISFLLPPSLPLPSSLPPSPSPSLPPYSPQDDLLSHASLLKEANAISVELQKHVSFQFLILTDTPYSPVPFSVATGTDVDIDLEESKFAVAQTESVGLFCPKCPIVAVEVKDSKHGATHVWSISKLK